LQSVKEIFTCVFFYNIKTVPRGGKLEIGNWKLEIGNWKLEIGNWKLLRKIKIQNQIQAQIQKPLQRCTAKAFVFELLNCIRISRNKKSPPPTLSGERPSQKPI